MEGYNGYTNHETWLVSLHYDDYLYGLAKEYLKDGCDIDEFEEHAKTAIMQDTLDSVQNDLSMLAEDLLIQALRKVNFEELAQGAWQEAMNDLD